MWNNLSCGLLLVVLVLLFGPIALFCSGIDKSKWTEIYFGMAERLFSAAVIIVFDLFFFDIYGLWCFVLFVMKSVVIDNSQL